MSSAKNYNFILIPQSEFTTGKGIGKISENSWMIFQNLSLPCILRKHEPHSGSLMPYPRRLGTQWPWGSWKALHEACCRAGSFQNNKVGMQVLLWSHLFIGKFEKMVISWQTILKGHRGFPWWPLYVRAITLLSRRSAGEHEGTWCSDRKK